MRINGSSICRVWQALSIHHSQGAYTLSTGFSRGQANGTCVSGRPSCWSSPGTPSKDPCFPGLIKVQGQKRRSFPQPSFRPSKPYNPTGIKPRSPATITHSCQVCLDRSPRELWLRPYSFPTFPDTSLGYASLSFLLSSINALFPVVIAYLHDNMRGLSPLFGTLSSRYWRPLIPQLSLQQTTMSWEADHSM